MDQRSKGKRARAVDDDDDEYDNGEGSSTQTQRIKTNDHADVDWSGEEILRKVKDTVRYALACEFKRQPIRRDDINKKILHQHTRDFRTVFMDAQQKLRHIFGMEMVELQAREKPAVAGGRKADSNKSSVTRNYILRNILPEKYNQPDIIKRSDEEYTQIGILYVILALIFVHEQALADVELKQHLDRLRVADETTLFGERDKLLDSFVKQGYLHRQKTGHDQDPSSDAVWEYYWGPRAKAEIPEENMVEFIASMYGAEGAELERLRGYIYKTSGYDVR
ncbi:hypothetical protein EC973_004118 [Apophysomyces ossiformis]|uniref:MAGE domain-containing protein n=1 Tax=Apophysomyces ossiformis TaxID=679940 RepID=A0A8H7BQH5_9FUNG|nr:hypothetical protein EC973_004118 [Apophysomyces ossiformis]